jgi:RNA polymerase sigma factor (sigma-70 family)
MTSTDITWNEHRTRLLTFVRRRVASFDDAEDLVQDILLKAARHTDQLHSDSRLEAWLYRIARNAIADYYRASRPAVETLEQDVAKKTVNPMPSATSPSALSHSSRIWSRHTGMRW